MPYYGIDDQQQYQHRQVEEQQAVLQHMQKRLAPAIPLSIRTH
jgi:hypothetical protein